MSAKILYDNILCKLICYKRIFCAESQLFNLVYQHLTDAWPTPQKKYIGRNANRFYYTIRSRRPLVFFPLRKSAHVLSKWRQASGKEQRVGQVVVLERLVRPDRAIRYVRPPACPTRLLPAGCHIQTSMRLYYTKSASIYTRSYKHTCCNKHRCLAHLTHSWLYDSTV